MKLSQISKSTPVVIFINLRSCFVTNQTPLGQKGNSCDVLGGKTQFRLKTKGYSTKLKIVWLGFPLYSNIKE